MIAYTKEDGADIAKAVDMVNVMSYDLINRRDNVTKHASSVEDSRACIQRYKEIGLPADKLNLGFAYYAKWFVTKKGAGCKEHPLGCEMEPLETETGGDTGKSGVLTYEKGTMGTVDSGNLKESTDGSCGYDSKTKCPDGQCCSQYGTWYVAFFTVPWPYTHILLLIITIMTAEQPTPTAKEAVSPTTAPAKAPRQLTPGAAPKSTAKPTRKPAASTTLTTRPIFSGRGRRPS